MSWNLSPSVELGLGGERNHLSSEKTEENCVPCYPRFWLVVRMKRHQCCSPLILDNTLIGNSVLLKYFHPCHRMPPGHVWHLASCTLLVKLAGRGRGGTGVVMPMETCAAPCPRSCSQQWQHWGARHHASHTAQSAMRGGYFYLYYTGEESVAWTTQGQGRTAASGKTGVQASLAGLYSTCFLEDRGESVLSSRLMGALESQRKDIPGQRYMEWKPDKVWNPGV